jgi:hypothetical protein
MHEKLLNLKFDDVDPYDFAKLLFEECNEQSFFEPLKEKIPEKLYAQFLTWFPNYEELLPLVNQEFFEYMRQKVLDVNEFITKDGYHNNKKNIVDIKVYLYQ